MPPSLTKVGVEKKLRRLGISAKDGPVGEFGCPLCSEDGDGPAGHFVFVGVPSNGKPLAWNNLPTKPNVQGVRHPNLPISLGIGSRRCTVRRHVKKFHADQAASPEFQALTAIWRWNRRFNYAGGKPIIASKRKAPSGGKPASRRARIIIPAKTTAQKKATPVQQFQQRGGTGGSGKKRAPVSPCLGCP